MLSTSHDGDNIHPNMLLVTDDKPAIHPMLQSTLKKAGFRAQSVLDAEDPFRHVREETEVVILDIPVSRKNRRECLMDWRKKWPFVPVIIITANDDLQIMINAMKEESFDCLANPFNSQEVVSVVNISLNTKDIYHEDNRLFYSMSDSSPMLPFFGTSAVAHALTRRVANIAL